MAKGIMSSPSREQYRGYKIDGNISRRVSQVSDSSLDRPEILEFVQSGGTRQNQSQEPDEEVGRLRFKCPDVMPAI